MCSDNINGLCVIHFTNGVEHVAQVLSIVRDYNTGQERYIRLEGGGLVNWANVNMVLPNHTEVANEP